jgi:predicted metal-dependent HD superfamily phosphohydrolase
MLVELARAYSEPHRAYHVLTHPAEMIELGNKIFDGGLSDEQIMAIWYHDYVYVAGSKTNELDSAQVFMQHYKEYPTLNLTLVATIILDTKDHFPTIPESEQVIDLDLIGLSDVLLRGYWQNAINVRKEYSAFTDEEWREGRMKFLQKMLDRKQIYYTDFVKSFESQARDNMKSELNLLLRNEANYK